MPRPIDLSLDLLRTFAKLADAKGDASAAASHLQINQPSMSKRLRYLQHAGRILHQPWLQREGKKWKLTPRGHEVLPAVQEIVRRYDQLRDFVKRKPMDQFEPIVHFACGQLAATGLAREAAHGFAEWTREQSDANRYARLRITTPRGKLRIRGVALGSFDLAVTTHEPAAITRIARRRLHVELVERDYLTLVCAKQFKPWNAKVEALKSGKVKPADLIGLPLILPEPDAGLRRVLDRVFRTSGVEKKLQIALESGGWKVILEHVCDQFGVGIVNEGALRSAGGGAELIARRLDPGVFPPSEAKLICRYRLDRPEELDLSPAAEAYRQALLKAARASRVHRRTG
jgi:DNA-binding transcriptional LysR family regulator